MKPQGVKHKEPGPVPARPESLARLGAAIRRVREHMGHTLDTLAAATGISKPYLSNIETGRAPGPASAEKLRVLARALQLDEEQVLAAADWLRTPESVRRVMEAMGGGGGEGHQERTVMESPNTPRRKLQASAPPRRGDGAIDLDRLIGKQPGAGGPGVRQGRGGSAHEIPVRAVPVINQVAAGKAAEFTDLDYPAGVADSYVPAPDLPEAPVSAAFAVRVRGDSMMPEYAEGEILIVGPAKGVAGETDGDTPEDGQDCVVRLGEMEQFATTFKRVFYERDSGGEVVGLRLVPLNPAYAERQVKLEEVTGVYPVMYRLVKPARGGVKETERSAKAPVSFTTTRVAIEND